VCFSFIDERGAMERGIKWVVGVIREREISECIIYA
jgi:hypothetical protein